MTAIPAFSETDFWIYSKITLCCRYPNSEGGFKEELFREIITDQFLYQMADGPTHLRGNKLDCVFCNIPELITNVNCINPTNLFPSDHYLIEFDIKLCFQRAKAVRRTIYDFKNANFNAVRQHLLSVPLYSAIVHLSDVDECWEVWKDLFLKTIDQFVPNKTVLDINTPPWIDREVKHLINKKHYQKYGTFCSRFSCQRLSPFYMPNIA